MVGFFTSTYVHQTPGPMTELNFWAAQCINLESLFEQMQSNTTIKMASILFLTDSAYYPAFKSGRS